MTKDPELGWLTVGRLRSVIANAPDDAVVALSLPGGAIGHQEPTTVRSVDARYNGGGVVEICLQRRERAPAQSLPVTSFAPASILSAALHVLFICACTTRNWTLGDAISRKQIYNLWEAVHEIPDLLTRWRSDSESELIRYLDEYDQQWDSPSLRATYEQKREAKTV